MIQLVVRPRRRGGTPPSRTELQRLEALQRANEIRVYRAQLKRDLKTRNGVDVVALLTASPVDERLETMKVIDLLLAVPKYGRVKVNAVLQRERISPSKTIGGLSYRQRAALIARLGGRPMRAAHFALYEAAGEPYATPSSAGDVRSRTPASGDQR